MAATVKQRQQPPLNPPPDSNENYAKGHYDSRHGNNMKRRNCWNEWCCPGRCGVFTPLAIGLVIAFSITSFAFALWAWNSSRFAGSQVVYYQSGIIPPTPYASVLGGALPMQMTFPNNLLEYIGGVYDVTCASPVGHTIILLPGILPLTWDGNHTKAVCQVGYENAGFMFRVIAHNRIRVIDPKGVSFVN